MTFTICGDIHAKVENLDTVEKVFKTFEDLGNPVILLGDLLHQKSIIQGKVLKAVYKFLEASNLQYYIIPGNHDYFNLESTGEDHSLITLNELANVEVFSHTTILETLPDVAFVPYRKDPNYLKRKFSNFKKIGVKTVFGHFDIQGFNMSDHKISSEGLETKDILGVRVISGHYHTYQENGNVIFLGSPFSQDQGECNQTKFMGIFDSKTHKFDVVETSFRAHRSFQVSMTSDIKKNENEIKRLLDSTHADDIVRMILKGNLEEIRNVDKSKFLGIHFVHELEECDIKDKLVVNENDSNEKQFENWGKKVKKLEQNTINLGLQIMESVK